MRTGISDNCCPLQTRRHMTKSTARRHHYLPASYLAGFTESGNKNDQFFVLEVQTGKSFKTSPKNVAVERDFNRVNVSGIALDAIETALSPFEEEAVQAIRTVSKSANFPVDMDYHRILNFLCLIAVRNPALRETVNRSREQVLRIIAEMVVSDEKTWERAFRSAANDPEIPQDISYAEMKQFVEEGNYKFEFSTDSNLDMEFQTFDELLPVFYNRIWTLLLAPESGPEFICCDHPVVLTWKGQRQGPVGFGLQHTEVFFPLSRRTGFYGVFENPLKLVVELTPKLVAQMNAKAAQQANRHVYCAVPEFVTLHKGEVREVDCGVI